MERSDRCTGPDSDPKRDDTLELLYSEVVGGRRLLKNPEVFDENYLPDKLPGRKNQILDLAKHLKHALHGAKPPNVVIYGKSGTGKSAVVKYVLNALRRIDEEKFGGDSFAFSYVSCRTYRTLSRALDKIVTDLAGVSPNLWGMGIGAFYEALRDVLTDLGKPTVVVLDEVDFLRNHSDLLYNLTRTDYGRSKVCVVCISNSIKFLNRLDPSVVSSLSPVNMYFPQYNALELGEILRDRAEKGLEDGALSDDVVPFISATVARESGDARRAIKLLEMSVLIAEDVVAEAVTLDHVKAAVKELDKVEVREALNGAGRHVKLTMLAVAAVDYALRTNGRSRGIKTGEAYQAYKALCSYVGEDPVSQRRFVDYLSELESLDLISVNIKSFGKRGRTRVIRLGTDPEKVLDALVEEESVICDGELSELIEKLSEEAGAI